MVNVGKDTGRRVAAHGARELSAPVPKLLRTSAARWRDRSCTRRLRLRAANRSFGKSLLRRRRAQALLRDGKDHGEGIVHPMGELAQQHGILLLGVCGR